MPQSSLTVFRSETWQTPDQHSNSRTLVIINDTKMQQIVMFYSLDSSQF